jgi:hypothetical protein
MTKAVEVVLLNIDQCLCSWHIEQNTLRHLRGKILEDFRKFIYHPMDVEEFERRSDEFKCDHKITESDLTEIDTRKAKNMWLLWMYDLRNKWSATYMRGRTFLGMQSNQRSDSLNSMLHSHLDQ